MTVRKQRLWIGLALLTITLAVLAWFEPTGVVRGRLRGEAFYQGRPTNYWSRELERWSRYDFTVLSLAPLRGGLKIVADGEADGPDEIAITSLVVAGNAAAQANDAVRINFN